MIAQQALLIKNKKVGLVRKLYLFSNIIKYFIEPNLFLHSNKYLHMEITKGCYENETKFSSSVSEWFIVRSSAIFHLIHCLSNNLMHDKDSVFINHHSEQLQSKIKNEIQYLINFSSDDGEIYFIRNKIKQIQIEFDKYLQITSYLSKQSKIIIKSIYRKYSDKISNEHVNLSLKNQLSNKTVIFSDYSTDEQVYYLLHLPTDLTDSTEEKYDLFDQINYSLSLITVSIKYSKDIRTCIELLFDKNSGEMMNMISWKKDFIVSKFDVPYSFDALKQYVNSGFYEIINRRFNKKDISNFIVSNSITGKKIDNLASKYNELFEIFDGTKIISGYELFDFHRNQVVVLLKRYDKIHVRPEDMNSMFKSNDWIECCMKDKFGKNKIENSGDYVKGIPLVLFDDFAYSGTQMKQSVENFIEKGYKHIIIVLFGFSDVAKERFDRIEGPKDVLLELTYNENYESVKTIEVDLLFHNSGGSPITPICMEYKVPDERSTATHLYTSGTLNMYLNLGDLTTDQIYLGYPFESVISAKSKVKVKDWCYPNKSVNLV